MNTKKGSELRSLLNTIQLNEPNDSNAHGVPTDLWRCMPDQASGRDWVGFIVSVARDVEEILSDDYEHSFDDLTENVMEYAENNSPVYYKDQFEMVNLLDLWAIDDVEETVEGRLAYDPENPLTLRSLMGVYCAAAYEITWLAICNFIMSEEEAN